MQQHGFAIAARPEQENIAGRHTAIRQEIRHLTHLLEYLVPPGQKGRRQAILWAKQTGREHQDRPRFPSATGPSPDQLMS